MPKRTTKTELYYVYGPTGSGKTTMVSRFSKYVSTYWQDGTKWWNNYEQEELVVIDEYHGQFDTKFILKLGDFTPLQLECKGGYCQFNSCAVFFLSNLSPDVTLFHGEEKVVEAIKRRFRIIHYE